MDLWVEQQRRDAAESGQNQRGDEAGGWSLISCSVSIA